MPHFTIHVEHIYNVEAADDAEALRLAETWRTGGVPPNLVSDSRAVFVTDEMGEDVEPGVFDASSVDADPMKAQERGL